MHPDGALWEAPCVRSATDGRRVRNGSSRRSPASSPPTQCLAQPPNVSSARTFPCAETVRGCKSAHKKRHVCRLKQWMTCNDAYTPLSGGDRRLAILELPRLRHRRPARSRRWSTVLIPWGPPCIHISPSTAVCMMGLDSPVVPGFALVHTRATWLKVRCPLCDKG
jgi:hypothetical protein